MQQTLSKVKNLERFIEKHGEDSFISQTISKMLGYKIQQYEVQIERLDRDLERYESIYNKESSVFFREYEKGEIGDDMDFIEWSSLYQIRNNLIEKKREIEESR